MKQESNEFFCPIELIEPNAFANEFQLLNLMLVKCNRGYVCTTGDVE